VPDLTSTTSTRPHDGAAHAGSVLWMRHGTSHDGVHHPHAHVRPDTPLADVGHDQVLAAATHLHAAAPALVVSSPVFAAASSFTLAPAGVGRSR